MFELMDFHDYGLVILTLIITFVGYALLSIVFIFYRYGDILEPQNVRNMWTTLPRIILVFWAFFSFSFLYLSEESEHSTLSIKTIGGECYECYLNHDYSYLLDLELTAYLLSVQDLEDGKIPVFQVDDWANIPWSSQIWTLTAAFDLMHAWNPPPIIFEVDISTCRGRPFTFIFPKLVDPPIWEKILDWVQNYLTFSIGKTKA